MHTTKIRADDKVMYLDETEVIAMTVEESSLIFCPWAQMSCISCECMAWRWLDPGAYLRWKNKDAKGFCINVIK